MAMPVKRSSTALFTTMLKVCASLSGGEPLSVTRTVTGYVPGPCASVGVRVTARLVGLMLAPRGARGSRLYVGVLAGTSGWGAAAVKVRVSPSLTVWFLMGARDG